ncbi:MAG: flippase-like domain-containing protein [Solirubrobacterales bacterium]|nr:flippase-like domain-containing protein [Solirubrobacterales bacterium]
MSTTSPEPAAKRGSPLLQWAGVAVSLVCVAAVVWWAAKQPAPDLPDTREDVGALLLAILLYGVATALRAERWKILIHDQGGDMPRADAYGLTVVGYMGNNVLPARGGDVFRVMLGAPRSDASRRTVIGTLLAERLLDIAVLVVLFVVLAVTIAHGAGLPEGRTLTWLLVGAAIALVCLAVAVLTLHRRGLLAKVRAFVAPMLASTLALRGRHGATMVAITMLIWTVEAGVWGSVGAAANIDMSVLESFYLVALASMFSMIPSGPGYAGTQDAAAVIGIKAIGGTSSAAVSYLILVRFVLLVPITAAGLVLVATRYGGLKRLRTA